MVEIAMNVRRIGYYKTLAENETMNEAPATSRSLKDSKIVNTAIWLLYNNARPYCYDSVTPCIA